MVTITLDGTMLRATVPWVQENWNSWYEVGPRSSSIAPPISMWPCKKYLSRPKFSYLTLSNLIHKTKIGTANRWRETTNSNPHGPIKLYSQSTKGVRLCCAFYHPQQQQYFFSWRNFVIFWQINWENSGLLLLLV